MKPAPFIRARYPPPLRAMAIFGKFVTLLPWAVRYESASKSAMFARVMKSFIGCKVAARLFVKKSCSLWLRPDPAPRIVGLVEGQVTILGA